VALPIILKEPFDREQLLATLWQALGLLVVVSGLGLKLKPDASRRCYSRSALGGRMPLVPSSLPRSGMGDWVSTNIAEIFFNLCPTSPNDTTLVVSSPRPQWYWT
jgi:uncharacterized protein YjeT (DUF2065 family)